MSATQKFTAAQHQPDSVISTPGSERSEDELGITANTTITTELVSNQTKEKIEQESFTLSHKGTRGISHQVDKDGSVHLRPKLYGKGKKIRTLVSFRARESHFDRNNKQNAKDPFRGFYTLFWIGLAILMFKTFYTSFSSTGQIVSMTFATLFSQDAIVLAISDGVLVASLFVCVPFAHVLRKGYFRYWPTLIWVQHAWQALLLAAVIKWTHYRDWPWVQSGFFTLHCLSMMCKMHSYLTINGEMADKYRRMKRLEKKIEERVAEVEDEGGSSSSRIDGVSEEAWRKAVERAREATDAEYERRRVENRDNEKRRREDEDAAEKEWNSLPAQRGTSVLRQRANASVIERRQSWNQNRNGHYSSTNGDAGAHNCSKDEYGEVIIRDPHPLATHPDQAISDLAREVEHLREDLTSSPLPNVTTSEDGVQQETFNKTVTWPENISMWNFFDYILCPTLVYELSYPRTKAIRPLFLLEKVLATFGTFFVIYVITEHFIIPKQPSPETPILRTFLDLAVPMMINYLLIFFIIFECVLQGAGEITRFADRLFYEDWWNATSMDVFSRRWNKPVHSFLLRHVYASSITAGVSRSGAMFVTFLLSSLLHELVMAIVSGKIRGYLFAMQMAQIPLMWLSQIPFVKRNEALGNIIFWTGLFIGFPMLNIAYITF